MVVQEESAIRAAALEVIGSVKSSQEPLDEMLKIATKYAASLRQTLALSHSFLESLQVVAEGAERAKGQTPRIGFSLKELINVQKKIEEKRHLYSLALVNDFITPLKEKAAHDAKTVSKMEKDYEKLTKKSKETMKKATVKSVKMTKQVQKGKEDQSSLDAAMKKVNLAMKQFDDEQRKTLKEFLVEERKLYCYLVSTYSAVVKNEYEEHYEGIALDPKMRVCLEHSLYPDNLPEESQKYLDSLPSSADTSALSSSSSDFMIPPAAGDTGNGTFSLSSSSSSSSSHHNRSSASVFANPPPPPTTTTTTTTSIASNSASSFPPPPPPPAFGSNSSSGGGLPPPPPPPTSSSNLPPPPPPVNNSTPSTPLPPPPPVSSAKSVPAKSAPTPSSAPPPPPPPPPPADDLPDPAGNPMLAALQKKALKKAETNDRSGPTF